MRQRIWHTYLFVRRHFGRPRARRSFFRLIWFSSQRVSVSHIHTGFWPPLPLQNMCVCVCRPFFVFYFYLTSSCSTLVSNAAYVRVPACHLHCDQIKQARESPPNWVGGEAYNENVSRISGTNACSLHFFVGGGGAKGGITRQSWVARRTVPSIWQRHRLSCVFGWWWGGKWVVFAAD